MEIERSVQNIHLDHDELLALVCKAFPHCKSLDAWEILSGGAINTTYKLQIGQDTFVLRLYTRDRSYCKTEKDIHKLIDSKVSTPKLLYADEKHEPWAFSIFEFAGGVHLSEISEEYKKPLSYELGRTLATIHAHRFDKAGLFGEGMTISRPFEKGSRPYFEESFSLLSTNKNVRSRLGEKLADNALLFIQKYKDFFSIVDDNICLTHSDFKPVNLLYVPHERVFVLDWEFAHAGCAILDFAILLRHRKEFPFALESLVKGYKDFGGVLSDEWLRCAFITDFVNIVTLLDHPSERPKLFERLKSGMQNTMSHWDDVSFIQELS